VYVNGKVSNKKVSAKVPLDHSGNLFVLAGQPGTEAITGAVDEFRIYDRALSAREVAALAAGRR
jgi:hypothetical protein